jgi:DNA modification methylase
VKEIPSVSGKNFQLFNGDCVEVTSQLPDESVDFMVFSPPFANLYIYSDDIRDMGNCKDLNEFFAQYGFLSEQLYRILKVGRLMAVHCKQIVRYKGRDGVAGWTDFRGELIRHYEKYGFTYHSEVVIWTDPVLEMQKTKTQRLLYKQLRHDASHTGIGMPEYLLIFRKWDEEKEDKEVPIRHYKNEAERAKEGGDERQIMDLETWQRYASPVWFDIRRTDVLNVKAAREEGDEKHICPLQLPVIERAIDLWTNPGDVVLTPFLGIGSEAYVALQKGRKAIGVELKESYFRQAVANCKSVTENAQVSMEDLLNEGAVE